MSERERLIEEQKLYKVTYLVIKSKVVESRKGLAFLKGAYLEMSILAVVFPGKILLNTFQLIAIHVKSLNKLARGIKSHSRNNLSCNLCLRGHGAASMWCTKKDNCLGGREYIV